MKKSLIALAVLAAAGAASAQSSVTLGGILKEGFGQTKNSGGAAGTVNSSNRGLIDGSSRLLISGVEDLGGGMSAYFQMDTRFRLDDNGPAGTANGTLAGGNTFVGLRGGFGALQLGRLDTHYCTSVNDDISGNGTALALQASNCSLQGYVNGGTAGRSIAVTSRSTNTVRYTTPNLSGFTGVVSYSFNPYGSERGANSSASRGGATHLGLNYDQGPLAVRFSAYNHKITGGTLATSGADGGTAAGQRAYTLGVGYDFGVAKVGLTYDRSELRDLGATAGFGAGATRAQRNTWIVPVTVPLGTGALIASYSRATNVETNAGELANTGANQWTVGYNYPLSKRTSLGVNYTRLNNNTGAQYQLYTNNSLGNAGAVAAGVDQSLFYVGVRHVF